MYCNIVEINTRKKELYVPLISAAFMHCTSHFGLRKSYMSFGFLFVYPEGKSGFPCITFFMFVWENDAIPSQYINWR